MYLRTILTVALLYIEKERVLIKVSTEPTFIIKIILNLGYCMGSKDVHNVMLTSPDKMALLFHK